jgi:hypothetical protein
MFLESILVEGIGDYLLVLSNLNHTPEIWSAGCKTHTAVTNLTHNGIFRQVIAGSFSFCNTFHTRNTAKRILVEQVVDGGNILY